MYPLKEQLITQFVIVKLVVDMINIEIFGTMWSQSYDSLIKLLHSTTKSGKFYY
jgi:hypothetical protein